MYGSAIRGISIADCTRVGLALALERVLQRERVHHRAEHADVVGLGGVHAGHARRSRPRQKLPPPTTTATSTPRSWRRSMISRAVWSSVAPSRPDAATARRAPHPTA